MSVIVVDTYLSFPFDAFFDFYVVWTGNQFDVIDVNEGSFVPLVSESHSEDDPMSSASATLVVDFFFYRKTGIRVRG